jgi:hypothetical protein
MSRIAITFDDKELQKRLEGLVKRFDKKTKKAILRKGAVIVAKTLKAQTPKDTGSLTKMVTPMTWSRSEDYFASFNKKKLVYNRRKKKAVDPFFAAFLNEGWTHTWKPIPHGAQKKGTDGAMVQNITKHKGFIEQATRSASPAVVTKIEKEVIREIAKTSP